jgi:hypothetical protein
MTHLRVLAALALVCPAAAAPWNVVRSAHFEVWSDAAPETARALDTGLERLHAFFAQQVGIGPRGTVRVLCFASERDFAEYRIRPGAAGFSLTAPQREYIVVTGAGMRIPAHEYAHLLIHSSGWKLPEWISEGIGEVVSSVRVGERYSFIGGDLPGRSQLLKAEKWMTPAELFAFGLKGATQDLAREPVFYSESWALAEMLIVSPAYSPRFSALLAMLANGSGSKAAIEGVYQTSIDTVFRDLHERQAKTPMAMPLHGVPDASGDIHVEVASGFAVRSMLADLRYATGDLDRAETMYRGLAEEQPRSADVVAALGMIALERRDMPRAIEEWRKAIALGIPDADLCFRYVTLAEDRGLDAEEVRAALERALVLRPDFDVVHFKLALLDKNQGHAESAVRHLRAMRTPRPERAWDYYSSLADALLDMGDRTAAKQAAIQARQHASSDAERARAQQLAWFADSELSVEIAADAQGVKRFRTVRVPANAAPRNPFIEAEDDARTAEVSLDQVECAPSGLRILVKTTTGPLTLTLPDPSRVQIRNGGGEKFEFTCGPQQGRRVTVEYTATGILRGIAM